MMSRRLKYRIKRQCSEALLSGQAKRTTIAEFFSQPGVVLEAVRRGGVLHGSYDLTTATTCRCPLYDKRFEHDWNEIDQKS